MTAHTHSKTPLLRCLTLLCFALVALGTPAWAQDDDDDFETGWVGVRLGAWYRPEVQLKAAVSGRALGLGPSVPGTSFDAERDLGVTQSVETDLLPDQAVPEAEVFFDSEWISISLNLVAPHRYRGERILQRTINFGGQSFTAGVAVQSKLEQFTGGAQVKLNLLNNRIIAISPLVGLRVMAVDWEIEANALGLAQLRGDTSDIDSPIQFEDFQLLVYPEVGVQVKVGLRKYFEVDARLSGMYVSYLGYQGGAIEADVGATVYPIPYLGVRLGYRYLSVDFEARRSRTSSSFFDFDLNFHGPSLSVVVRF